MKENHDPMISNDINDILYQYSLLLEDLLPHPWAQQRNELKVQTIKTELKPLASLSASNAST